MAAPIFTPSREGVPTPTDIALAARTLRPDAWGTMFRKATQATHPMFHAKVAADFAKDYSAVLAGELFFERLAEEMAKIYDTQTLRGLARLEEQSLGRTLAACETGVAVGLARAARPELDRPEMAAALQLVRDLLPPEAPLQGIKSWLRNLGKPRNITAEAVAATLGLVHMLHPEFNQEQRQAAAEAVAAALSPADIRKLQAFFDSDLGKRWLQGRPAVTAWVGAAVAEKSLHDAQMAATAARLSQYALAAARRSPPNTAAH